MKEDVEEQLLDLLCKKAVYGLSESEERELADLQRRSGGTFDPESFELAAAALSFSGLETEAEIPANLRARISADAERYFDELESSQHSALSERPARTSGFRLPAWLGWAVAAAACIALGVTIYTTRLSAPNMPAVANNQQQEIPVPLDPAQQRQELIKSAPDLVRAAFGAGNVKTVEPEGDIVWSDAEQKGYMRLRGLPVNNHDRETYQLWIFDETQDPATPIDGGTFDVNSQGEVIVPVNPTLHPRNTKAFAITIEKAGGVVVSKRERIVALAKREA